MTFFRWKEKKNPELPKCRDNTSIFPAVPNPRRASADRRWPGGSSNSHPRPLRSRGIPRNYAQTPSTYMAPLPPPAAAAASRICCVSLHAPGTRGRSASFSAARSSARSFSRFAARSSSGGGTHPGPKPGDDESKAVLEAFFLGKAFAEALTERVESVVGEVFSVVGQWQAEQQKQVQEFQEEVVQRAQKAKGRATMEVVDKKIRKTLREPSKAIVTPAPAASPPPTTTPTQEE
ncbi:hypothetical protein E2562_038953 [Oryza meyeriana var. granulata]|uniref:Uncharacterized protein n=1 Tax=Oryza meyeriana var. granulata TaxID=110450 RepID=A0A6G1C379_9ORYZ|nr:hypothetical protein E2562_038953 [Oryza meyeriana var. granulata]